MAGADHVGIGWLARELVGELDVREVDANHLRPAKDVGVEAVENDKVLEGLSVGCKRCVRQPTHHDLRRRAPSSADITCQSGQSGSRCMPTETARRMADPVSFQASLTWPCSAR